jgi:hypothetical protein
VLFVWVGAPVLTQLLHWGMSKAQNLDPVRRHCVGGGGDPGSDCDWMARPGPRNNTFILGMVGGRFMQLLPHCLTCVCSLPERYRQQNPTGTMWY